MFRLCVTKAFPLACRAVFLGTHLVAIGFLANLFTPRAAAATLHGSQAIDLAVDVLLLFAFALQVLTMRTPVDVRRWFAPTVDLPASRSVTLLATSRGLVAVMLFWRPLDDIVWATNASLVASALVGLCATGVLIAVLAHLKARSARDLCFASCLVAVWNTPTMTLAHLLIATAATIAFVTWVVGSTRSAHHGDDRPTIGDAQAGRFGPGPR